ncbi:MAG: hypothetical protein SFV51_06995 [Bryobacteraceae bacterium]|nr:hypothetical protein [Bryobacteraceae bacterium]
MKLLLLLVACFAPAADLPRVFYSKSFPGSTPAYVQITVDKAGRVEYREATDDDDPLISRMEEAEVNEIFGLAEKLDWFSRPLESGLKVARMGDKTFRMENHEKKGEQKFNYTLDETGKQLQDWFERITESAYLRINLERAARFDKLGVNKALLQIEASWDRKRVVSPAQFLPMLDRVAKNESYLHMARDRAAALAEMFRNPPKATE